MRSKPIKILIILLFLLAAQRVSAQFSIYALPPPPAFSVDDLWNLNILLNGSSQFESYFVTLDLFEKKSGKVSEARTREFLFESASLAINKSNYESYLENNATNYVNNEFYMSCSESGGRVPPGSYTAKYTLWGVIVDPVTGKVVENLLEYELEITEYAVYPPSLIQVYDRDTIFDLQPVFSWTPPFPLSPGQTIQYRIRFAEQYEGQIAEEAMLSNPAVLELEQNQNTVLVYPSYSFYLISGTTYAWQVSAYAGNVLLGKSEVWSFLVQDKKTENEKTETTEKKKCETVVSIRPGQAYSLMKDKNISFSFPEDVLVDSTFSYRIYDKNKNEIKLTFEKLTKSETGVYHIKSENIPAGMYLLVVQMEKDTYYLRFKIDQLK
jgi:hypothetical protein